MSRQKQIEHPGNHLCFLPAYLIWLLSIAGEQPLGGRQPVGECREAHLSEGLWRLAFSKQNQTG